MPLLTLTSDIGSQDFLVVAISHNLSPFNYPQAAYVCRNAIKNFPEGTFHLVLVNLFDQRPEHLLLVHYNNQYIGCADNGLITMILEEVPQHIVALSLNKSAQKNTLY